MFKTATKLILVLTALTFFLSPICSQEEIPVQIKGFSETSSETPSFIYMYEILDGVVGVKKFVDIISVSVQGEFSFPQPKEYTRVYEFEAPPWSWKVMVRSDGVEKDTLSLFKPSVGARRLRGNAARAVWGKNHPSMQYDSLRILASKLDELVLYDRMILSGAVGRARSLADTFYIDSVNQVFENACFKLLESEAFLQEFCYADLVRSRLWQWRIDSGWGRDKLKKVWLEEMHFDTCRSKLQKARSPGWCSSWIEVHGDCFLGVEHLDSLQMNTAELDFAMWWWDLKKPNSLASVWWERHEDSPLAELRSLRGIELWGENDLESAIWTTPSSDLVHVDELFGSWGVILVVKNGSGTSLTEWSAFRAVENSLKSKRKNLQFVVLCIDGTQKEWDSLVSKRKSVSETLRWVGADCRWLDGLGITSMPQTIIVSPSLKVHSNSSLRPSNGLGGVLYKLPR